MPVRVPSHEPNPVAGLPCLQFWNECSHVTHVPVAKATVNIGDDIQSFAASQLLGCREFVDRDAPQSWPKDALIPLIGWYGYGEFPASSDVLVVGIHLNPKVQKSLSCVVRDWLKASVKRQGFPAMARDIYTRDFLRKCGVDAEFGGCVTQTLKPHPGPRCGELVIDVPDPTLKGTRDTHQRPHLASMPMRHRVSEAEIQLRRYAHTKMIHTTRLHAYLPARALGTPVQLHTKYVGDATRLTGHVST